MKAVLVLVVAVFLSVGISSCTENLSNGERVGFLTKFSNKGLLYKTWEGELNLTQTGMNTSSLFEFSVDGDAPDETVIKTLDSAATFGWKIKIRYHQVKNKNITGTRGETDYFASAVEVLDRNPMNLYGGNQRNSTALVNSVQAGRVDTIYVVIWKNKE